jgi:hypothetical protein
MSAVVTASKPAARDDIIAMLGPLDDLVIAEIIGTGATADELTAAANWVVNDEALMNIGEPLPRGRVARLVEIIAALKEAEQEESVRDR